MEFYCFIPSYGCKNPNIRHFIKFEDGTKKELKHFNNNIYYYNNKYKKIFVAIDGNIYKYKYKILKF